MAEVNMKHMKYLIRKYYQKKQALAIRGTIGIGKSEGVHQEGNDISMELGRKIKLWNNLSTEERYELFFTPEQHFVIIDRRVVQEDSTDNKGIPALISNTNDERMKNIVNRAIDWKVPLWLLYTTLDKSAGFIFCDEFNLAPDLVQKAYYQLALDRALGECKISDGFMVIIAGNTDQDRSNITPLSCALQSRFGWADLKKPTKEEWLEWGRKYDVDPRILSYIYVYGDTDLWNFDFESSDMAQPIPRNWKLTSDLIRDIENFGDIVDGEGGEGITELESCISSRVGLVMGHKVIKFLKMSKKVDIQDILKNPKKFDAITEIDVRWACLPAIAELYKKDKSKILGRILDFCNGVKEKDFSVFLLHYIKHSEGEDNFKKIANKPEFIEKIKKLKDYIE